VALAQVAVDDHLHGALRRVNVALQGWASCTTIFEWSLR
jgi:hypothetical protein